MKDVLTLSDVSEEVRSLSFPLGHYRKHFLRALACSDVNAGSRNCSPRRPDLYRVLPTLTMQVTAS